jgi:hypothetical protein
MPAQVQLKAIKSMLLDQMRESTKLVFSSALGKISSVITDSMHLIKSKKDKCESSTSLGFPFSC